MSWRPLILEYSSHAICARRNNWYNLQAAGLGAEFLRAVDACLSAVERNPSAYLLVHQQIRRALLRKFPYSLFYLVETEEDEDLNEPVEKIVVLACFHAKRDPKQWQSRIE